MSFEGYSFDPSTAEKNKEGEKKEEAGENKASLVGKLDMPLDDLVKISKDSSDDHQNEPHRRQRPREYSSKPSKIISLQLSDREIAQILQSASVDTFGYDVKLRAVLRRRIN